MRLTQEDRAVVDNLAKRLKSEIGAEQVVLYGSAARGTLDSESDIDLLVVLPHVDWEIEKQVGGLAFEAGLEIDRVISTLCFSTDEIKQPIRRNSPLLRNIAREGVSL